MQGDATTAADRPPIVPVVIVMALCLVMVVWWAAITGFDRARTDERARGFLTTTANLLREQIRHALTEADHSLVVIARLAAGGFDRIPEGAESWHAWLAQRHRMLPAFSSLSLVAPDGTLVATSDADGTVSGPAARRLVEAHRDGLPLHLDGTPGDAWFTISRRVEAEGVFRGIAVATYRGSAITDPLGLSGSPPLPLRVALLQDDGESLLEIADLPSAMRLAAPLMRGQLPDGPAVAMTERSDGAESWVTALARVPGLPLAIAVSAPRSAITARWVQQAVNSGALTLIAVLAIAGLAAQVLGGLARERQATAALRRANTALEAVSREHQRARRAAEAASAAKSRLLAAVSHDLSQPLHALLLNLEAGAREPASPAMRHRFARMQGIARLQQDMLDQLVQVSVLEAGRLTPAPQPVALDAVLDNVVALCAAEAAGKGLVLRSVRTSLRVRSDPALLTRILLNLVSNAVRHTRQGRVLVGCRHGENALRIEVWDTGPGIPPDQVDAVFDDFHRIAANGGGGLGLGLAIVRRTADLLGLAVTVRSHFGRGACFTVSIPWASVLEPEVETTCPTIRTMIA